MSSNHHFICQNRRRKVQNPVVSQPNEITEWWLFYGKSVTSRAVNKIPVNVRGNELHMTLKGCSVTLCYCFTKKNWMKCYTLHKNNACQNWEERCKCKHLNCKDDKISTKKVTRHKHYQCWCASTHLSFEIALNRTTFAFLPPAYGRFSVSTNFYGVC
jgi:hypothetical protein